MDIQSLAALSDSELLARAARLAQGERRTTAALVAHLAEIETRKLYLGEACSSLFTYCVRVLHLSEPAAYNRIQAARAARRFPAVLVHLEHGHVHLAAVKLLAPVLTMQNHQALLAAAAHKSKREVEELVARQRPQPDVPARIRKLPAMQRPVAAEVPQTPHRAQKEGPQAATAQTTTTAHAAAQTAATAHAAQAAQTATTAHEVQAAQTAIAAHAVQAMKAQADLLNLGCAAGAQSVDDPRATPLRAAVAPRAEVVPLAPERYKVQFTAGAATLEKLRRAQELLRHRVPDGDVATVIDLALELLVQQMEKRKFAATERPRSNGQATMPRAPASRHIPADVRRAVWARDQGQCTFVSAGGERCTERARLEFDHIHPRADGGEAQIRNLRLLCRQHNQYEAEQFFGPWHADAGAEPKARSR